MILNKMRILRRRIPRKHTLRTRSRHCLSPSMILEKHVYLRAIDVIEHQKHFKSAERTVMRVSCKILTMLGGIVSINAL
ncbi:hypothetical protein PIB30_090901 [Stylosanthes scabra]|uniref:Uncharacterized protein n=1 Tax=Stylosanthes scabra TaxID=79078 RepID=A0ABU6QUA1_9FABA|nr:hypothetical protein [Stylosanthes scabra]